MDPWTREPYAEVALGGAEDAIRSANDTRYGLNAVVFTRDLSRAHWASAALRAGTAWVNCFLR